MIHVIVNKIDNTILYEGIDKADCLDRMRSTFMSHISQSKEMSEFPFMYDVINEDDMLDKVTE